MRRQSNREPAAGARQCYGGGGRQRAAARCRDARAAKDVATLAVVELLSNAHRRRRPPTPMRSRRTRAVQARERGGGARAGRCKREAAHERGGMAYRRRNR
jgi:hypothetical protein